MFVINKACACLRIVLIALFIPFAAFAEGEQYTVTYDCGDGTGTAPANATATNGQSFNPVMVLKNSCEKSGYVLSGWLVSGTSTVVRKSFTYNYTEGKTLTAQWVEFEPKFTLTTTNMAANKTFKYWQGAEGLFYVDWGDGTLQTINFKGTISHTYATAGVHTIRFGGLATDYYYINKTYRFGSVSFGIRARDAYDTAGANDYSGTPEFVAGISGSLGAIYPSLSDTEQPRFIGTFSECTNLSGSIPANLFSGVTGSQQAPVGNNYHYNSVMFDQTFYGCSGLTGSIPPNLFGDLYDAATDALMFRETFRGCSKLTGSIPPNLFGGVTGIPRMGLFAGTFWDCSGLTGSIPATLFENISGDAGADIGEFRLDGVTYTNGAVQAFGATFTDCSGLTGSIPADLFKNITGSAPYLFANTFSGCANLTGSIPVDLFKNITGSAQSLFSSTFSGCSNLTGSIPADLFRGVSGAAPYMFNSTFASCERLSGSIPADLFRGVTGSAVGLFQATFAQNYGLSGPIPGNLFRGVTGSADELFYGTFNKAYGLSGSIPADLFAGVTGSAKNMFNRVFSYACSLSGDIPDNLFRGVTGSAVGLFQRAFDMNLCGADGLPESQLNATYISPALFAGVNAAATDEFTNTFRATPLLTECPCGAHSATTAYNLSTIDGRAVCVPGLKTLSRDGVNEYYYTGVGGQTTCVTGCNFATDFKTENGLSYPLLHEQITVPSIRFKSGDEVCHVPLETGDGGTSSVNLKWDNNLYHMGNVDSE